MNDVTITKENGGLNRGTTGEDHISSIVVLGVAKPAGYGADDVKKIESIEDAEAFGIVDNKSDETKASGSVEITSVLAGVLVAISLPDYGVLGSYKILAADTEADVAVALRAAINAATPDHGFTAAGALKVVSLIPPVGLGDSLNGVAPVVTLTGGAITTTITAFAGGVDAKLDLVHYQVSEFFRIKPDATLYVGFMGAIPEAVSVIQRFTEGKVRQIGIVGACAIADLAATANTLQAAVNTLFTEHMPIEVVITPTIDYQAEISGINAFDLRTLNCPNIHVLIGQDGSAKGAALFAEKETPVPALGCLMGTIAKSAVHENIGWVAKFNLSEATEGLGQEMEVPALISGALIRDLESADLEKLHAKGYIFAKKHVGRAGTYWNDSHGCVALTSDYAYLEDNRTMDKAVRQIRTYILPYLNGPLRVDKSTGKLAPDLVDYLEDLANSGLREMERAGELSGYKAVINPDQNVLATSELLISIKNVKTGVARTIRIKVSYATSV